MIVGLLSDTHADVSRTEVAMRFFRDALAGKEIRITPLLWGLRLLQSMPE